MTTTRIPQDAHDIPLIQIDKIIKPGTPEARWHDWLEGKVPPFGDAEIFKLPAYVAAIFRGYGRC